MKATLIQAYGIGGVSGAILRTRIRMKLYKENKELDFLNVNAGLAIILAAMLFAVFALINGILWHQFTSVDWNTTSEALSGILGFISYTSLFGLATWFFLMYIRTMVRIAVIESKTLLEQRDREVEV